MPGLAAATLRPLLEGAGITTDVLHGHTLFPWTDTARSVLEAFSGYLFVPAMTPTVDRGALADRLLERYRRNLSVDGLRCDDREATWERLDVDPEALRRSFLADMTRAEICVDRIVEWVLAGSYEVVGFSCTFEQQLPAAVAVARRLRRERPDLRLALGGATCFEEQGDGLAASFPEFDAICHTEGEAVAVPLVRALLDRTRLSAVPGIAWRDAAGTLRRRSAPPVLQALDTLPVPDYRAFIAQFAASEWADKARPRLLFEASRGCWWGQKHLCTFCGLNPEGLGYRHKSPARLERELFELVERYPDAELLHATDNILPMGYIDTVLARLGDRARLDGPTTPMAFMVKSNLRRDQLQTIRDAGIGAIQAGVESLHDEILANMDKGATVATQLQLLKWASEVGISVSYNLIIRNPGDSPEHYREIAALIPFVKHLAPPTGVTPMMLSRFSRYFQTPERWGIANVRPHEHYRDLWPEDGIDLDRIAYESAFDHPMLDDAELTGAARELIAALERWIAEHRPDQAHWSDLEAGVLIADNRGEAPRADAITGMAADLFRTLDSARRVQTLPRYVPGLDPEIADAALATWAHRRWVAELGDRWLGILPRRQPNHGTAARSASERAA